MTDTTSTNLPTFPVSAAAYASVLAEIDKPRDVIPLDERAGESYSKLTATVESQSMLTGCAVDGAVPYGVRMIDASDPLTSDPYWLSPAAAREVAALLVKRADEADALHAADVRIAAEGEANYRRALADLARSKTSAL